MVISSLWFQVAGLTFLVGFAVLGYLAYRIYRDQPPIPGEVRDEFDKVLFTSDDILAGQHVFQRYGLMQHGTLFGHGAYLGPDFTAQYLHIAAEKAIEYHTLRGDSNAAPRRAIQDIKTNTYSPVFDALIYPPSLVYGLRVMERFYAGYFDSQEALAALGPLNLPAQRPAPVIEGTTDSPEGASKAEEKADKKTKPEEKAKPAEKAKPTEPPVDLSEKPAPTGAVPAISSTARAAAADRRRRGDSPADGLFLLGRMGGVGQPRAQRSLLYQQLAARAAGRQHAHRRGLSLERAEPDRAAGRHGAGAASSSAATICWAGIAADEEPPAASSRFRPPEEVRLAPAQRATAWYFLVVAGLFLLQGLLGGVNAHYHVEPDGFYGVDIWPTGSPTTCRACGTCNWRCSSSPPASWPWASSSPR